MRIEMQRKFTLNGFQLTSKTHPNLTGDMNITFGIRRRCLTVQDSSSKITYELKQKSRLQRLLGCLPMGNLYPRPHFDFYKNGYPCGRTKPTRFFSQTLLSDFADTYEMFRHGENYISILKNGEQVALLQRDPRIYNACAKYTGHYQADAIDPAILMLWAEYVDIVWFPMHNWTLMSTKKYYFHRREPFRDRIEWQPSDGKRQEVL